MTYDIANVRCADSGRLLSVVRCLLLVTVSAACFLMKLLFHEGKRLVQSTMNSVCNDIAANIIPEALYVVQL